MSASTAQAASGPEATPDRPRYDVAPRGDADGSRWTGRQRVSFRNASARPLREVYVRLWGNGTDGCGTPGTPSPVKASKVTGGTAGRLSVNCTALRIALPKPLARDERAALAFDLSLTVPDRNSRFGREGAFRFPGNALPALAVHDAKGWHLDPYVSTGESFYALASDFRVTLDHPTALKIPATGRTWTRPAQPGRSVTHSVAHRVRDFARAAGPFRTATETTPGGVRVRSYWAPDTSAAGVRLTRQDGAAAVDRFGEEFGRYPYGEIDLVTTSGFGGGMEYPGLLLGTTDEGGAVVHEVAHQWWYGIVGNDEYGAPWLDESFAQSAGATSRPDLTTPLAARHPSAPPEPRLPPAPLPPGATRLHMPGGLAHLLLDIAARLAPLSRVLDHRDLRLPREVAPGPQGRVVRLGLPGTPAAALGRRPVHAPQLLHACVRLLGRTLLLHQLFEDSLHTNGA